jgi:DNA-binding PadR family transcriptional regulator
MSGDAKADSTELVLLSLLAERPLYGYAITKEAAARSEGRVRLTPGVLYPLLKALESQGLILSTWETVRSDRGPEAVEEVTEGRRRKWYRLSAKGRKRLEQRVAAHRAYRAVIDAFIGPGLETEETP